MRSFSLSLLVLLALLWGQFCHTESDLPNSNTTIVAPPPVPKKKKKPFQPFQVSVGFGGIQGRGVDHSTLTVWLMSLRLGAQLPSRLLLEAGVDHFLYTAFVGLLKYQWIPDNRHLGVFVGLGAAAVMPRINWEGSLTPPNVDSRPGLQLASYYLMPAIGISWPFYDVKLKIENFTLINPNRYVLGAMAGVTTRF